LEIAAIACHVGAGRGGSGDLPTYLALLEGANSGFWGRMDDPMNDERPPNSRGHFNKHIKLGGGLKNFLFSPRKLGR